MRMNQHLPPFGIVGIGVASALLAMSLVAGCTGDLDTYFGGASMSEGQRLMEQHCGTCHLPVAADALDKATWLNSVLPAMAPKLGISVLWENEYYQDEQASGAVSMAEWLEIVEYFRSEAPDTLRVPAPPAGRRTELPLFSVHEPQVEDPRGAATTMVAIDTDLYSAVRLEPRLSWFF